MAPTVFWIGLGNMGRGMCKNIVAKGNLTSPLLVYNRSVSRAEALAASLPAGTTQVVTSLAEGVAAADLIFTCLANDEVVTSTITAALASVPSVSGKLFVECSTIHPDTTTSLGQQVEAAGATFLAAPVFGAPAMADAGQLIVVTAGPSAAMERARPFFTGVIGRSEIPMVDEPWGRATTLKVLGNTFVLNLVEQLAETLVVAEKCGLGIEPIKHLVDQLFPGPYAGYVARMVTGDYYKREEPLFAVDLARKDARHAMKLAKDAGARLQNVETGDAHLAKVKEHQGERGDIAAIYGAVRQEAGLKFENDA